MTAAANNNDAARVDATRVLPGSLLGGLPVKAGSKLYAGTMIAYCLVAGVMNACRPQDSGAVKVIGVSRRLVDNSASLSPQPSIETDFGCFYMFNATGADAVPVGFGGDVYAVDDQTVSIDSAGGTRLRAGYSHGIVTDSSNPYNGRVAVQVAMASPDAASAGVASGEVAAVLNAAYVVLAAGGTGYTGTLTGTLTSTTHVALGTQDGQTPAVNDLVWLPAGTSASQTIAAGDEGLWQVSAIGSGAASWVLTRPANFPHGGGVRPGTEARIAAGTLFADTVWFVDIAANKTIDTDALPSYPRSVTQAVTLVGGTKSLTNVPIRSLTKSNFTFNRTVANTCTLTVGGYATGVATTNATAAGALGTAKVDITACVGAGTINVADISTGNLTITN